EAGALIVKLSELDAAAPGVATLIVAVPAVAIRLAGTMAVSRGGLTKFVVRTGEFHRTVEPVPKLVPPPVMVNAGPPAAADAGAIEESPGAGPVGGGGADGVSNRTRLLA